MTPKEKAREIFDKYWLFFVKDTDAMGIHKLTKECALIAVDLLIAEMYAYDSCYYDNYYFEVKKEIEKL